MMPAKAKPAGADAPRRFLRLNDITRDYDVSRVSIWRWVKTGAFPPPRRIGRTPFWSRDVVDAHMARDKRRDA